MVDPRLAVGGRSVEREPGCIVSASVRHGAAADAIFRFVFVSRPEFRAQSAYYFLKLEEFVDFIFESHADERLSRAARGVKSMSDLLGDDQVSAEGAREAAGAGAARSSSSVSEDARPVAGHGGARAEEADGGEDAEDEEKDDDECPLCFSEMWRFVRTPCGHSFCLECLKSWLEYRKTCPMCRQDLKDWQPTPDGSLAGKGCERDEERCRRLEEERRESDEAYFLHHAHSEPADAEAEDWLVAWNLAMEDEAANGFRGRDFEGPAMRERARGREPVSERGRARETEEAPASIREAREMARLKMLEERERMRPEQERIRALVPEGLAFVLRVGHRPRLLDPADQVQFVEPVQRDLPLAHLIREVRFQTYRDGFEARSRRRRAVSTSTDRITGPKFVTYGFPIERLDPSFKVHIIWRTGLDMVPLSLEIRTHVSGAMAANRQVAVELPDPSTIIDAKMRKSMKYFMGCLDRRS